MARLFEGLSPNYRNFRAALALRAAMRGVAEVMPLAPVEHNFNPGKAIEATPAPLDADPEPDPAEFVKIWDPVLDDRMYYHQDCMIMDTGYQPAGDPGFEIANDGTVTLHFPDQR